MLWLKVLVHVIGSFWASLKHRLQLLCIVYPIEGALRLWYHLDPRLYSQRLRIRRISEGRAARDTGRFVLFVFMGRQRIPSFTLSVLEAIERRGLNLVVSTNSRITPGLRAALLDKACLLIERANLGRDFGGYKDGISIIGERFGTPARLILLNDSLYFFDREVDRLVAALDGHEDLIGMCEDHYHYYHIQSFALSFGRHVLANPRISRYWRNFRPVSTRRWAVGKGERGLTRQLLKAGFKPHILYSAAGLLPFLKKAGHGELLSSIYFLPAEARESIFQQLQQVLAMRIATPLPILDTMSKSARRLQRTKLLADQNLQQSNIRDILSISHRSLLVHEHHEEWALQAVGEAIGTIVGDRNQIHFGGFLFLKYLGMPAIKRDLFFRELYSLDEIDEHLSFLQDVTKEEIMSDVRQKGTARLLFGLSRILYQHGAI